MLSFLTEKRERYYFVFFVALAVVSAITSLLLLWNAETTDKRFLGSAIGFLAATFTGIVIVVLNDNKWKPAREQKRKEAWFKELTGFTHIPKGAAQINAMGPVVERIMREKAAKAWEACREEDKEQQWNVDAEINLKQGTDLEIAKMKLSAIAGHERNLETLKRRVNESKDMFHSVAHLFIDMGFCGIQQNMDAYKKEKGTR